MSAQYREVLYQTKKFDDATAMVTEGRKNPAAGRMDFYLQHFPDYLKDENITNGNGNLVGNLIFNPEPYDGSGNECLWRGSKIGAVPGGPDQVRGKTPSLIVIDEGAFHEELNKVIVACNPAVADGGQLHVISSVDNGSDFNAMVLDTQDGEAPKHEVHPVVAKGMEILGLRWPRGMRSWQTRAGFWVLELHYRADPNKDPDRLGAEWIDEAVKGYPGGFSSPGWKTEMEIDYESGGGHKVFDFLSQSLPPAFIDSIDPERAMLSMNIVAGYDFGSNNPSAFEVWGIDEHGKLFALWELYEPCTDYRQHCHRIKMCPYFDKLEYIAADNKIFSKTQHTANGLKSIGQLFIDEGVLLSPARQGVDYPIAMRFLGDYWQDPKKPRAFITADCPNLRAECRGLRYQEHSSSMVSSRKNNPEKLVDVNNHAWDATAYAIDRQPSRFRPDLVENKRGSINEFLERAEKTRPRRNRRRGGIICPGVR